MDKTILIVALSACKLPEIPENSEYEYTYYVTCDTVSCQDANNVLYQDGKITCTWDCVYPEGEKDLARVGLKFAQSYETGCWELWSTYVSDDYCDW